MKCAGKRRWKALKTKTDYIESKTRMALFNPKK
jgi:hypothetical protein